MFKISLINMPFANLSLPSIALTQLKAVTEQRFGERVRVRALYLNHEVAHYVGQELFAMMTNSMEANNSGLGDWFFRQVAFPELPDNTQSFFQRYFPLVDEALEAKKGQVLAKRAGLPRFLQRLIAKHGLAGEDMVGLTSMFAQNVASFAMARMCKVANPRMVTVMGGANCEAPMGRELALHVDAVDFVFSGPALVTFPQVVSHLLAGEVDRCHEVRGVLSRRNADAEQSLGVGAIGAEMPIEVAIPLDYGSFLDDLDRSFPNRQVRPSLTFETSRGCWWGERSHCTFCGLNGSTMAYRAMAPDQAVDLFHELFARYADRCSRFESVDNILPRSYLTDVLPRLETPPGVSIFYEVKADLKDAEMEALARAGVTEIQPGIESLATSTLKLMKKGTSSFQNLAFLKNCVRFGINPVWNLLIGFPGEEEAVYKKYLADMPVLAHLPPPSGAFPVRFDRYSPYFVRAAEYGLDLSPYDFYRFIYPFGEESLRNMAYYFEDRNYDSGYMVQMIAWQEKLNAAVNRWKTRWMAADGKARAELFAVSEDGSTVVHDTRSGALVRHELGDLAVQLTGLHNMNGWKIAHAARSLGVDEQVVASEVESLRELGLVFTEGDRFLSLVLAAERTAPELAMPRTTMGEMTAAIGATQAAEAR